MEATYVYINMQLCSFSLTTNTLRCLLYAENCLSGIEHTYGKSTETSLEQGSHKANKYVHYCEPDPDNMIITSVVCIKVKCHTYLQ